MGTAQLSRTELARLVELGEKMGRGMVVEEILDHVFTSFRDVLPYHCVGFARLETDRDRVRWVWSRSDAPAKALTVGYVAPLHNTGLTTVLESGVPQRFNDVEAYAETHPASDPISLMAHEGFRSVLACPLHAFGRPVGFLFFSCNHANAYAQRHAVLFARLAGQLSSGLERARLYQEAVAARRDLQEALFELERVAAIDSLTGLANRRALDRHIELQWRTAVRRQTPLSLVMIDVDHFKRFNDALGHQAGDECLALVAESIENCLGRPGDMVGRYGGEEFLAALPDTNETGALAMGQRILEETEHLGIRHPDSPVSDVVTLSLGIATTTPSMGLSLPALLRNADRALYEAKRDGRNLGVLWHAKATASIARHA